MTNKCKYCDKEGVAHFGILDTHGIWRYEFYSCKECIEIGIVQQSVSSGIMQMEQRWKDFGKRPILFITNQGI